MNLPFSKMSSLFSLFALIAFGTITSAQNSSQGLSSPQSTSASATPSCVQPRQPSDPSPSAISSVLTSAAPNACNISTQKISNNGLLDTSITKSTHSLSTSLTVCMKSISRLFLLRFVQTHTIPLSAHASMSKVPDTGGKSHSSHSSLTCLHIRVERSIAIPKPRNQYSKQYPSTTLISKN